MIANFSLPEFKEKILKGIKIHTIRRDKNLRWHEGLVVHCATGNRTPNYECFAEYRCTGVEEINIWSDDKRISITKDHAPNDPSINLWETRWLDKEGIEELAISDGFETVEEFFAFFSEHDPFTGRIIHWTDKRYIDPSISEKAA